MNSRTQVLLGKAPLTLEAIAAIADGHATISIDEDAHTRARIAAALMGGVFDCINGQSIVVVPMHPTMAVDIAHRCSVEFITWPGTH